MPLGFGEGLASGNFFKVKAVSDRSNQDRVNETVLFVLTLGLSYGRGEYVQRKMELAGANP